MTREQQIHMLVAMLAPLICENQESDSNSVPQIRFLSATEVEIDKLPGAQLSIIKKYTDNPLKELLTKIVDYHHPDKRDNWEESCIAEGCVNDDEIDLDNIYDPTFCTGHIYHVIHQLQELSEDVYQAPFRFRNSTITRGELESLPCPFCTAEITDQQMYNIVKETDLSTKGRMHLPNTNALNFNNDKISEIWWEELEKAALAEGVMYYEDL